MSNIDAIDFINGGPLGQATEDADAGLVTDWEVVLQLTTSAAPWAINLRAWTQGGDRFAMNVTHCGFHKRSSELADALTDYLRAKRARTLDELEQHAKDWRVGR